MMKRKTSGDWIIDAREHIKEFFGVDTPAGAVVWLSTSDAADWIFVELVASAMDKAYQEAAAERTDNERPTKIN